MKIKIILIVSFLFSLANAAPYVGQNCKPLSSRLIELDCNGNAVDDPAVQCLGLLDAALRTSAGYGPIEPATLYYIPTDSERGAHARYFDRDNSMLLNTADGEFRVRGQTCLKVASDGDDNIKGRNVYEIMKLKVDRINGLELAPPEDFYNKDVKFSYTPADCAKLVRGKNPKLAGVFTKLEGKFVFPKSTPSATSSGKP